jgi:hypothetical protein
MLGIAGTPVNAMLLENWYLSASHSMRVQALVLGDPCEVLTKLLTGKMTRSFDTLCTPALFKVSVASICSKYFKA